MTTRRELVEALRVRYRSAAFSDRIKILDESAALTEFVALTCYHSKHAIRVSRGEISPATCTSRGLRPDNRGARAPQFQTLYSKSAPSHQRRLSFLILRNTFSRRSSAVPRRPPGRAGSARAAAPYRPRKPPRKHRARLSIARRCASASPWACRLPGSLSRFPIQAAAGWCPPAAWLDHRRFLAGRHRPACGSADRRRLDRRRESLRAARILAPGRETTPVARRPSST